MYTFKTMLDKIETGTASELLAYAEMAWDAMGYRTPCWDANGKPVTVHFYSNGVAYIYA